MHFKISFFFDNRCDCFSLDVWKCWNLFTVYKSGRFFILCYILKRQEDDPRKVEKFQIIIAGSEVGNGYSELNDPLDQEKRFTEQRKLSEEGDSEAMEHDDSFIEALKYGMPPACGFGISERFFSFLMNRPIRECVMFPLMKPEGVNEEKKSKKWKIKS